MIHWVNSAFLELKNTQGSGIDGKLTTVFALPVAYSSVNVHHKIENKAPYAIGHYLCM